MEELPCGTQAIETDFGTRSLNKQKNNKTIVVPKVCLENLGSSLDKMNVSLVQGTNGEKFIKLANPEPTPDTVEENDEEDE